MTLSSLFLFMTLLIINYIIYKRKNFSKTFFIITNIILLINFILIYVLYYNNISLGFEAGIAVGDLNGMYIDDEYKYFYESDMLSRILQDHGLLSWFNNTLPQESISPNGISAPYGFYNPFVFILSFLKLIGFKHLNELLTIKLIFVLINLYLLFDISSILCSKKFKYAPLLFFNLAPAYLLINITLSRDLIITTLILYIFKFIIIKDRNYKKLILPLICLLIFRCYVVLTLLVTISLLFRNSKRFFSKIDLTIIILIFTGIFLLQNLHIPIEQIEFLKSRLMQWHGNALSTPFNLTISTLRDIFVKSPYLNFLKTPSIYCIMISLSSLYYMLVSLIFIIKISSYIISKKSENYNRIIKLTLYFMLLNAYILMMRDGFITTRLTNMWFFMFVIIIFMPFENVFSRYFQKRFLKK
ncbi:hypothetical protein [Clostridium gasigenes]|uniref:Dolichyl-phosphate-mannose-protein mannosyltransferase n=1 Tax=Clostridium gasigenes TaxID=94869 RepID=A0A7X0VRG1_9CLOT|nr:hypothetical protein [Clostridium gasigenes]MBB6713536.1 hypothetical protein [Clostridium gasigenes]